MHHGILGQKWGVRRYQNLDGTLTAAGRERYGRDIKAYPEIKLRRQVGIVNYVKKGKYGKAMDEYAKYARKNGVWDNPKAVEEFVKKLTRAKLSDIGYEPTDEAVAYLRSRPWYNVPYAFLIDNSKGVMTFRSFYDD